MPLLLLATTGGDLASEASSASQAMVIQKQPWLEATAVGRLSRCWALLVFEPASAELCSDFFLLFMHNPPSIAWDGLGALGNVQSRRGKWRDLHLGEWRFSLAVLN